MKLSPSSSPELASSTVVRLDDKNECETPVWDPELRAPAHKRRASKVSFAPVLRSDMISTSPSPQYAGGVALRFAAFDLAQLVSGSHEAFKA